MRHCLTNFQKQFHRPISKPQQLVILDFCSITYRYGHEIYRCSEILCIDCITTRAFIFSSQTILELFFIFFCRISLGFLFRNVTSMTESLSLIRKFVSRRKLMIQQHTQKNILQQGGGRRRQEGVHGIDSVCASSYSKKPYFVM